MTNEIPTQWSPQQIEAIQKIKNWYHEGSEQTFRLFGYAGTGKTSLARHIVEELSTPNTAPNIHLTEDVGQRDVEDLEYDENDDLFYLPDRPVHRTYRQTLYGAYTGKAAHVLRSKGCDNANTIHSLIYVPTDKIREKLNKLEREIKEETRPFERAVLEKAIQAERENLRKPDFVLKEDSELAGASLLVLDEVSMVNHTMAADLLSFGTKMLVLGDPAQLPPVEGGGYFTSHEPDHLLTEIHRSALNSPVTRLATTVRRSHPGDRLFGVTGPDGTSGRRKLNSGELLEFDQVIVGTNRTRWQFISVLRALRGLTGPTPQAGDQIIILANNKNHRVFNGQQLTVNECTPDKNYEDVLNLEMTDEEGEERKFPVLASGFKNLDGEKQAKMNGRGRLVAATFGQAITCHKSQGSQWNRVMVIDESSVFRRPNRQDITELGPEIATERAHNNARSWLYTAVTRAAEQAVILDI